MSPVARKTKTQNSGVAPVETSLQTASDDRGHLGRIFGNKDDAAVYIAGAIGLIALVGTIITSVWGKSDSGDVIKMLGGIVVAALSFIGGASGRGQR